MDQGFAGVTVRAPAGRISGPEVLDFYVAQRRLREPKGQVARQLLAEFTAKRSQDRFALIVFSALPIPVLGFTQKQEVIQAAISAGNVGRGLSETNIGIALEKALAMFEDRPYTGSRIVMLVSDGGDRIDLDVRERVAAAARKHRVAIYWLYLRSGNSPGLQPAKGDSPAAIESVPELMLNHFFESLETPYRAYEAGNSEALQQAIADVDRLENLPIAYLDLVPQRDLAPWCHGVALACVLLLLAASMKELRRWA
jgi:mxaC protein